MLNGVILSKLQTMDKILNELRSLKDVKISQLEENWLIRRAIERNLQVLSEIVIDVCQRLIAMADQSPATTGVEAVQRCVKMGALASMEPYRKMVQFLGFSESRFVCSNTYLQ